MSSTIIATGLVLFVVGALAGVAVTQYRKRQAAIQAMPDLYPVIERMNGLLDLDVRDGYLEYADEDDFEGILKDWKK